MTIAAIRAHRRRQLGRRRYVTTADGRRLYAGRLYWAVLWYWNVDRRGWAQGRADGRGRPSRRRPDLAPSAYRTPGRRRGA